MHRFWLLTVILLSILLLPGCFNRLEVNETIVAVGFGLDIKEGQKCFSAQLALPKPREGEAKGPPTLIISESGQGWAEAARKSLLSLPRVPLWSMANSLIIGENLAREDTALFVDFVVRNRQVRNNLYLFLARHASPEDILQVKAPPEDYSALALERIIKGQENVIGIYQPVTLKDFLFKSATAGIEPVIPQVSIEKKADQEKLKLDGIAVFKNRQMAGSLDEVESRGFRYLSPKMISGGLFVIKNPQSQEKQYRSLLGNAITLELIRSQATVRPVFKGDNLRMIIDIKAEGNFYEQDNPQDLLTQDMIKRIEMEANRAIKKDIQKCIEQAQLLNSDILGWGLSVSRIYPREWEELESSWDLEFSRLPFDIAVDFKIRRVYLLEPSFKFG